MQYTLKKSLGQHFLNDVQICLQIKAALEDAPIDQLLEIGPGAGALTQHILDLPKQAFKAVELDREKVAYLLHTYPQLEGKLINEDFLETAFPFEGQFTLVGNFPYNISTQIVFKTLEYREQIPFFVGMFQKEVAERICEPPGSKKYGILSVLAQIFYNTTYLFSVPPHVFSPPPKVDSAVMQMVRKEDFNLDCDEGLLFKIVKLSFQQRRKTLRNSLKTLNLPDILREDTIFDLRPEKLSGDDFIQLTKRIGHGNISS